MKKHRLVMLAVDTEANLVKGDLLLRHIWKGTRNECISLWRYNETVTIDGVTQYTTLNNSFRDMTNSFKPQHLYVLSNEDIEVDDWKYDTFHKVVSRVKSLTDVTKYDRKIVATTNKELLNHKIDKINPEKTNIYLPQIEDSFINLFVAEYNKGNIIEWVDENMKPFKENFTREDIQKLFEKLVVRGCFKTDRDYNIAKQTLLELTGIDYEKENL